MVQEDFPRFSTILVATSRNPRVRYMNEQILTVREVAVMLKINEKTVYRLALEGRVPGFKVGGSWRFRSGDIEDWIAAEVRKTARGQGRNPND